jgi:membrane associated rhomboid family serine protease
MLILPVYDKLDWKKPPVVTTLLIIINALIFFVFQSSDQQAFKTAYRYYYSSKLNQVEFPQYLQYLKRTGQSRKAGKFRRLTRFTLRSGPAYKMMHTDGNFILALYNRKIIKPGESSYPNWYAKHTIYQRLLNKVSSYGYGLTPARPTLVTRISHMFLHGSLSHLLGNMVFLFIVGFVVEKLIGSGRFVLCYFLTGLVAAEFYLLLAGNSMIPTIGASGVVSAVMAMYVVLFGLRKVKFFYFVIAYFDYIKLPAIIVLPFWMGNELYQWLTNTHSNVNYLIHLGGLIAGAIAAFYFKYTLKTIDFSFHDDIEKDETTRTEINQAMESLARLDYDKARRQFARLYRNDPDNPVIWEHYYRSIRQNPDYQDYHNVVNKILNQRVNDKAEADKIHRIYNDYLRCAQQKTKINIKTLTRLARLFCKYGHLADAEKIVNTIVRYHPTLDDTANLAFLLANAFYKLNNFDKHRYYLKFIIKQFPLSAEANQSRVLLEQRKQA